MDDPKTHTHRQMTCKHQIVLVPYCCIPANH